MSVALSCWQHTTSVLELLAAASTTASLTATTRDDVSNGSAILAQAEESRHSSTKRSITEITAL